MKDYRGNRPYDYFKEHKSKYKRGYHYYAQKTIGARTTKENVREKMHFEDCFKKDNQNNCKNAKQGRDNNKKNHGHNNEKGKNK